MKKQTIKIPTGTDPFDYTEYEIDLPKGVTKIYSQEPYVLEAFEMYSKSFGDDFKMKPIENGLIKATISEVTGNSAIVQLNQKFSTVIDLKREKNEYLKYIAEGLSIDLKVHAGKKDDYSVSFGGAVNDLKYKEVLESIGQRVAYQGFIKELVAGGYSVIIDGIEVFMPGSLASMNKLSDFNVMVGKTVYVCPINYSDVFKKIVVSHREYLKCLKPEELSKVKYDVKYKGKVTGCANFGIFAEFNTTNLNNPLVLTGLIPLSEMDETTTDKFTKKQFKDGDEIEFYAKFISDKDGNKIILTKFYINWEEIVEKYKPDTVVKFNVIKVDGNIIFGSIDNTRLIGTIVNYEEPLKIGDSIELKISKLDIVSKKLFLKKL